MTLRWSAILLILVDIMNFLFKIKHKKFSFLLFCRFQYVSILKTLFDDELIAYIFLFVRDESRFQFFLVDWFILVSFFEGETVERIPCSLSFDTRILKYWLGSLQFIDIYMFRPCLIIMMIVFVGLELTNTKSLNDTLFSIGESRSESHIKYARNLFFD